MAVIEVRSILLLDSEAIGVVVPGLDGELCDTWNTVVPWPVNLVDPMPVQVRRACQYSIPEVSGHEVSYQCIVVSKVSWLSRKTSTSSPSSASITGPGDWSLIANTGLPCPSPVNHLLVIVKLYDLFTWHCTVENNSGSSKMRAPACRAMTVMPVKVRDTGRGEWLGFA